MSSKPETNYTGEPSLAPPSAYSSVTDFFEQEPVEKAISRRKFCIARGQADLSNGPFQVTMMQEGDSFVDPSSIRINAVLSVLKKGPAGTWVALSADDATKVAPINLFPKALFSQIEVTLNQKKITSTITDAYGIKAYLETVCNYGLDAARGHLRCSYYVKDDPGKADVITAVAAAGDLPAVTANTAFAKRHKFIANSKHVHICEPLHNELTTLNRLIPSGLEISFVFHWASPTIILQSTEGEYRIQYDDFYLTYERVNLESKLLASFESSMRNERLAIFPITRSTVHNRQFAVGHTNAHWANMYQGILPETVIICMLDSTAYNGAKNKNYFNFQHFTMRSINLKKNSEIIPGAEIVTDFGSNEITRLARHFYDNLGIETSNGPCLLTYEDFCNGSTIIPFDLTNDRCALLHNHEKISGILELEVKFREPLTQSITILALCVFTDKFFITGPVNGRRVLFPTLLNST